MRDLVSVSDVRYTAAPPEMRANGVYGRVSFCVADAIWFVRVDVRKTREGGWVLAFPKRRDARGVHHSYAHPCNDDVRAAITAQVFAQLRQGTRTR